MRSTILYITHYNRANTHETYRTYKRIPSHDEEGIITWLHQLGFQYSFVSGSELHDIGDMDYFCGHQNTSNLDEIIAIIEKVYGDCNVQATYMGFPVLITISTPGSLSVRFKYPSDREDLLIPVFSEFEKCYCEPKIEVRTY